MLVGTTTEISKTQSVLLPVFQVRKFSPKYSAENFSAGIAKVKGGGKKKTWSIVTLEDITEMMY